MFFFSFGGNVEGFLTSTALISSLIKTFVNAASLYFDRIEIECKLHLVSESICVCIKKLRLNGLYVKCVCWECWRWVAFRRIAFKIIFFCVWKDYPSMLLWFDQLCELLYVCTFSKLVVYVIVYGPHVVCGSACVYRPTVSCYFFSLLSIKIQKKAKENRLFFK